MNVGFNNTNTFEHKDLKDVVFLVEATDDERHNLWVRYATEYTHHDGLDKEISMFQTDLDMDIFTKGIRRFLSPIITQEIDRLYGLVTSVTERNVKIRESRKHRIDWQSDSHGIVVKVGEFGGEAIWVSFSFAHINGHKVAFYTANNSQTVHHGIVENYMMKYFQRTHDGYTRWNHTDATNFHNCVNSLDDIDESPRKTKFKNYNVIKEGFVL